MKRGNLNRQVFAMGNKGSRAPIQPIPVNVIKVRADALKASRP